MTACHVIIRFTFGSLSPDAPVNPDAWRDAPYLSLTRAGTYITAVPYFDYDPGRPHTACRSAYEISSFRVVHAHRLMDNHRRMALHHIDIEFQKANGRHIGNLEEATLYSYVAGDVALRWARGHAPDVRQIVHLGPYHQRLQPMWRALPPPSGCRCHSFSSSSDEDDGGDEDNGEGSDPRGAMLIDEDDDDDERVAVIPDLENEDVDMDA